MGHLHDDIILLLRPESVRVSLFLKIRAFVVLNLAGIIKFKYNRKNEKDSGHNSKN